MKLANPPVAGPAQSFQESWSRSVLASRNPEAEDLGNGIWRLRITRRYRRTLDALSVLCAVLAAAAMALALLAKGREPRILGWGALSIAGAALLGVSLLDLSSRGLFLLLHAEGIEFPRHKSRILWRDLGGVQIDPGEWNLHLMSVHGQRIEIDRYLDGLGRLRAMLALQAPHVLTVIPMPNGLAIHPLEILPPLRDGQTWDPFRPLSPEDAEEPKFEVLVEEVLAPLPLLGTHRTAIRAKVTEGAVHLGEWISLPPDQSPTERTIVLQIGGPQSAKSSARKGERIELQLLGTGFAWVRPARKLVGRPLTGISGVSVEEGVEEPPPDAKPSSQ